MFANEDSCDVQSDCGWDVEMVPDSEKSDKDGDLDTQILQIISNVELEDKDRKAFFAWQNHSLGSYTVFKHV